MKTKRQISLFIILLVVAACQPAPKKQVPAMRNHVEWANINTIYELNTRQFSQEGTFIAVEAHLTEIKNLGIKTIWFMPIQPIGVKNRKGSLGSYYSIRDYTAINPELGTLQEFKTLVDKIHEMGIYVIIDWVANHTAWDHPWITQHPDWYSQDSSGQIISPVADWTDVADLNYDNFDLREAMIESMKFWVTEVNIDGFRCDVAEMVPIDFWEEAISRLDKIKPLFMLAEGNKPLLHRKAFDATYSWDLFHLMNEIAAGKKPAQALDSLLTAEQKNYPTGSMRLRFTTNHDENSWNGTVFERLGDGAKTFAVLTATIPGIPLIYNGQEAGMAKRLNFFERDPIVWHKNDFRSFYSRLFTFHLNNKAISQGNFEIIDCDQPQAVFAFRRRSGDKQVLVVLNLSPKSINTKLHADGLGTTYSEYFTGRSETLHDIQNLHLEPWQYLVYEN